MSTNGVIAIGSEHRWKGREHHFDSYPDALGATLWNIYKGHFQENLDKMLNVLLIDHQGWSSIIGRDWNLDPGYNRDNAPSCYCHGDRNEKLGWITQDDTGWSWVYVFDRKRRLMKVLRPSRIAGSNWYVCETVYLDEAEMPLFLSRGEY